MTKSITSALQTALSANSVFTATLLEIERTDGSVFRFTNHDTDLTYDSVTWESSTPFTIGAISHTANLSVDNCQINISTTGNNLSLTDFQTGLFQRAKIRILLVDTQDLTSGDVVLQEGWIGSTDSNELEYVEITVYGLMKLMDFEVGRVYQPSCDADFGDSRCMFAVNPSQAWSADNKYHVGEWVYAYDTTQMTAFTITNDDFESDGATAEGAALTGWTSSDNNDWSAVSTVTGSISPTNIPTGTYILEGGQLGTNSGTGRFEQFIYQDIGLVAAGVSATDIDNGKISVFYRALVAQHATQGDAIRIRLEVQDTNGDVLDTVKTDFKDLSDLSTWRTLNLTRALVSGARTVRLYVEAFRTAGVAIDVNVDNVEAYYWDHSITDPADGLVHKNTRVRPSVLSSAKNFQSTAFSNDGVTANSTTENLTGWVKNGSYWWTDDNGGTTSLVEGDYLLRGGDDSSGTPSTAYTLYQDVVLATLWDLDTAAIDLGRYFVTLDMEGAVAATTDEFQFKIEFYDITPTIIGTTTTLESWFNEYTSGVWQTFTRNYSIAIPATCRTLRFIIETRSTAGSDASNCLLDFVRADVVDTGRPEITDPVYGEADSATTWPTTAAEHTKDGQNIWLSAARRTGNTTVTGVTDNRNFEATGLSGDEELFIGGRIRWLSGNNAGQRNLIRIYDEINKDVTLYFDSLGDVQVGDRFEYENSCQKRFTTDCVTTFDNGINFRGFPYLPGKLTDNK